MKLKTRQCELRGWNIDCPILFCGLNFSLMTNAMYVQNIVSTSVTKLTKVTDLYFSDLVFLIGDHERLSFFLPYNDS